MAQFPRRRGAFALTAFIAAAGFFLGSITTAACINGLILSRVGLGWPLALVFFIGGYFLASAVHRGGAR